MDQVVELSRNGIVAIISLKGAELISLNREGEPSVLWKKNDVIWNRTAPNLFPIVGRLLNDSFIFDGKTYKMNQHGFAREKYFVVTNKSANAVDFTLRWDEQTLNSYPFKFELVVRYTLTEFGVDVHYSLKNIDAKRIGFSIGGHPGFQLKDQLDTYRLVFSNPFLLVRHELEGPYYSGNYTSIDCQGELELNDSLFENDAIVIKNPPFDCVSLVHKIDGELVRIAFDQLDAIGFWTKKDAPFFCIEPWWGWADELNHSGDFQSKAGLHWLEIGQLMDFNYSILLN
jgi:galactose mutarotase-like enzyme